MKKLKNFETDNRFNETVKRVFPSYKSGFIISIILVFIILISSNSFAQPTITSFSPMSGPIGTSVTIIGTNFDLTPSKNIVFFGATKATVDSSSATSLIVKVPSGATYENISVTNLSDGLTAHSSKPFTVTFPYCSIFDTSCFRHTVDLPHDNWLYNVSVSDFDVDGKPDLLLTKYGGKISVFRNTSSDNEISFSASIDIPSTRYPGYITICDINGDGKKDFVTLDYYENKVFYHKNLSTPGHINFSPEVAILVGEYPTSIVSGDLDNDGKPELVVNYYHDTEIGILPNSSSSDSISFASEIKLDIEVAVSLDLCDFDGDKKLDIAMLKSYSEGGVHVYLNTSSVGEFSFEYVNKLMPEIDCRTIQICDFDVDGKQDLVVFYNAWPEDSSRILRNTSTIGNISFDATVDFISDYVWKFSAADIDGNGKPDIVMTNQGNHIFSVALNYSTPGQMHIAPKVDFSSVKHPMSISVADFDGDGRPDFAITNEEPDRISIYKNYVIPPAPNICMVTVDTTSTNNIIYWDETILGGVDSIIIYRETTADIYKRIGAVSNDSLKYFVDTVRQLYFPYTGDPNIGSYRYKLRSRDTCGAYSELGPYHNTIFITHNSSAFTWNHYEIEGAPIPIPQLDAYHLLRKENDMENNWELIGGVASSQLTLNDPDFDSYPNALRRIETQWNINCSNQRANNSAYSNIDGIITSGAPENHEVNKIKVHIFPNPFSNETLLKSNEKLINAVLIMYNSFGQKVRHIKNISGKTIILHRDNLPSGIYFIQLTQKHKATVTEKIVITD